MRITPAIAAYDSSVSVQLASGSSRWASKPAETRKVGSVGTRDRRDDVLDQAEPFGVAGPRHRQVDRVPLTRAGAAVGQCARPRIQRGLMDADVEHLGDS